MLRWAQCRDLSRQIRQSSKWPTVRDILRPRGFSWIFRSRAPVSVRLYLAARDGHLLTDGSGSFALLAPPTASEASGPAVADAKLLRLLDKHWDLVLFSAVAVLLLGAELIMAILQMATATLIVATVMVAYIAVLLTLGVVIEGVRATAGKRRLVNVAIGQLRAQEWTVLMLHCPTGIETARQLVRHVIDIVAANQQRVLLLSAGITHASPEGLSSDLHVERLSPHHPVLVAHRPSARSWTLSDEPGRLPGRAVGLLLVTTMIIVFILAWFVSDEEARICALSCDGVPASYGDALYWLLSRMIGGDPDGLGAASPKSRVLGFLLTILGVYVLVAVIGRVLQQRMNQDARSGGEVVAAFEHARLLPSPVAEPASEAIAPTPPPAPTPVSPTDRGLQSRIASGLVGLFLGLFSSAVLHRLHRTERSRGMRSS